MILESYYNVFWSKRVILGKIGYTKIIRKITVYTWKMFKSISFFLEFDKIWVDKAAWMII